MPDIFYLFSKWWKQMLLVIILSLAIVAAIVFTEAPRYLSVTTALPASGILADKAKIFNNNIEGLYSSLGNPDDLDKILGTSQLDTVYLAIAIAYNLWDHYKIENKEEQVHASAARLKSNTKVIRSEFGELKIKVWDTDKNLAPQLANAVLDKLNSIHQSLQAANNKRVLESLKVGKEKLQKQIDSISHSEQGSIQASTANTSILLGQLQEYQELIGEYQLILDTNPAVLVVVEKARPSLKPDRPRKLMILIATAVISFSFSFLLALYLEKRKRSRL